jgi:hypothetical protein
MTGSCDVIDYNDDRTEKGVNKTDVTLPNDDRTEKGVNKTDVTLPYDLEPWQGLKCTFVNDNTAFIKIIKNTTLNVAEPTEFNFTATLQNGTTIKRSLTVAQGENNTSSGLIEVPAGNTTITEIELPDGWVNTMTGTCDVYDNYQDGSDSTLNDTDVTMPFDLEPWQSLECTFVNEPVFTISRTQGFWATHVDFASQIWNGTFYKGGASSLGPLSDELKDIHNASKPFGDDPLSFEEMMGGFWSKIPRESSATQKQPRTAVEQAQMQMLQQLLAAILNAKFCNGCMVDVDMPADGTKDITIFELIEESKIQFNNGTNANIPNILKYAELLDRLNNDPVYHANELPVPHGKADPKTAKMNAADIGFWDDSNQPDDVISLPDGDHTQ